MSRTSDSPEAAPLVTGAVSSAPAAPAAPVVVVPVVIAANVAQLRRRGFDSLEAWLQANPAQHRYIGRGMFRIPGATHSEWANAYSVNEFGLAKALELYEQRLLKRADLDARLADLNGCVLACWCRKHDTPASPEICHGDILVRLFRERIVSAS